MNCKLHSQLYMRFYCSHKACSISLCQLCLQIHLSQPSTASHNSDIVPISQLAQHQISKLQQLLKRQLAVEEQETLLAKQNERAAKQMQELKQLCFKTIQQYFQGKTWKNQGLCNYSNSLRQQINYLKKQPSLVLLLLKENFDYKIKRSETLYLQNAPFLNKETVKYKIIKLLDQSLKPQSSLKTSCSLKRKPIFNRVQISGPLQRIQHRANSLKQYLVDSSCNQQQINYDNSHKLATVNVNFNRTSQLPTQLARKPVIQSSYQRPQLSNQQYFQGNVANGFTGTAPIKRIKTGIDVHIRS